MTKGNALALALLISSAPELAALAADGKSVYDRVCYKCHRSGVDGAPKTGNKEDWTPRVAKGKEELLKSVIEGKGEMPPRAKKPELTDDELKAAVEYLLEKAQ